MVNKITEAIENQNLIEFTYDGCYRLVEPHTLGEGKTGKENLSAYQIEGTSLHGNVPDWKLFTLSKIKGLNVLGETFDSPRSGYVRGDSRMVEIYCEI